MENDPIGIFDSGLGGISVLSVAKKVLPREDFIFLGDSQYNPYGTKTKEEITRRCIAICDWFAAQHVKAIVIACNTATSACVDVLRDRYDIPIIGMEPALKVACEKGPRQHIAVWATELTLKEQKFARLMDRFDDEHTIYRVPCPQLVRIVEEDCLDQETMIARTLNEYLHQSPKVDSIVLGCTHFLFYRNALKKLLPQDVHIVDGNWGTIRHLEDILNQNGKLNDQGGTIVWKNTDPSKIEQSKRLLKKMEEITWD